MSDILNQEEIDALAVTADTPPEQVEQQAAEATEAETQAAAERARDEQGRFVAKEAGEGDVEQHQEGEQRQVPQQALHAEREQRKHWQAEAKKAQEQLAQIAALKTKLQTPPNSAPEAPPANEGDENGVEHLRARLAALEGQTEQRQRSEQLAQVDDYEMRMLSQQATADEESFRSVKPDYDEAINHLVSARAQELQAYGLDPMSVQTTIRDEAADIVRTAIAQGKSPSEMAYQIAQFRGYRPAQGQQQQQQQQPAQTNTAQATLDAIARGRAASKSPGQGGGAAPTQLNAATVAQMADDEFAALYATPEGKALIDAL